MGRRGPTPMSEEHAHRWQQTDRTKTVGGVTFHVDVCTLPRCNTERLRRPDQTRPSPHPQPGVT